MKRFFLILALIILIITEASKANGSEILRTQIFDPSFRTLKIANSDNFMNPPAIPLGSGQTITVSFDQLAEDFTDLRLRLIHCNSDWTQSELDDQEFLDGFNIFDLEDYAHSQSTLQHYVNYRIQLPMPGSPIVASGNYIFQIFHRDNPDIVLLQGRFMVYEDSASISGAVSTKTFKGTNDHWQQLSIGASLKNQNGIQTINPHNDLSLQVYKNGEDFSMRSISSPMRIEGNRIYWENSNALIFPAGNEYRRFENLSTAIEGMRIDSVRYLEPRYQIWIQPDQNRRFKEYEFDRTQHGRFKIRAYNASDSDLAADYINVNFTLTTNRIPGIDVFIDGEFSNGNFSDFNRMTYDDTAGCYRATIPLKHGSYNYRYLALPSNMASKILRLANNENLTLSQIVGDYDPGEALEGNKFETENEYWCALFFRSPGGRADRLIGFANITQN